MPDQSVAYTVMLKLFLSSDHVTAATGKTLAITISKAGGAFGNPNVGASNATEVSNGWYKFALDTTDTGTLGDLVVRGTSASCDDSERFLIIATAPVTATGVWAAATRTLTGVVSANIVQVNSVVVNGNGAGTKWGP